VNALQEASQRLAVWRDDGRVERVADRQRYRVIAGLEKGFDRLLHRLAVASNYGLTVTVHVCDYHVPANLLQFAFDLI
jgi:hypothetical protein